MRHCSWLQPPVLFNLDILEEVERVRRLSPSLEELPDVSLLIRLCACSFVSDSATPRIVIRPAPLSMGFFRQEHWSGLPFPSPGDLPDPGIKRGSPALAGGFFTTSAAWDAVPYN